MSTHLKRTVIIAAAGSGSRMGSEIPKQFLEIGGKPIIEHTIDRFKSVYPEIEIILVLPAEHFNLINRSDCELIPGGSTRFESVQNGLKKATGDMIGVHDVVRPFVSRDVIKNTFEAAEVTGAAIPVSELKDSIRQLTSDESIAVDRSQYRIVQTPQVFKAKVIKLAYEQVNNHEFTDDASVVEACGQEIALVEGNDENIKITTPLDLKLAKLILAT